MADEVYEGDVLVQVTDSVIKCSRCGHDHESVTFKRFKKPIKQLDGMSWDFWATCPDTGDPIIFSSKNYSQLRHKVEQQP